MEIAWWQGQIWNGGEKLSGGNSHHDKKQKRSFLASKNFYAKINFLKATLFLQKSTKQKPLPTQRQTALCSPADRPTENSHATSATSTGRLRPDHRPLRPRVHHRLLVGWLLT